MTENIYRITFIVTKRCNSKCKTCNLWKNNHLEELKKEAPFEKLKQVFNNSKYLKNIERIAITGGEPFLREDLFKLVDFFNKKYSCNIGISSNGILTNTIKKFMVDIKRMKEIPKININISIDGLNERHDAHRGIKCFDNAIKSIEFIKQSKIPVSLSFTISPDNYLELENVYEFSKKKGIPLSFRVAQVSEYYLNDFIKKYDWNPNKLKKVGEQIKHILKDKIKSNNIRENFNTNAYFISQQIEQIKNPPRDYPCYSGINSFALSPYGDVYPCIMLFKSMGNITKKSFDGIWDSEERKEILKYINQVKCNCWTECETFTSLNKNITNKGYFEECVSKFCEFMG